MKTTKSIKTKIGTALLLPLCAATLLTGCSSLPKDNTNVETRHFVNLHATRYAEIFLVGGNGLTGNLKANVYNTTYLNGYNEDNKDSAPQTLAEAFNPEQVKKEYHVLGARLNGPKLWMLDWIDVPMGTERDFDGLQARWCAELHLTKSMLETMGKQGYTPTTIARKSAFGYNKGTTVFLIDDADGNTWIMKGFELGLQPRWTFEEFSADPASLFKQLPPGWKYRTKVLDQDLVLVPETGIATIMPDEFFNVYDKTGPGYSNYKP